MAEVTHVKDAVMTMGPPFGRGLKIAAGTATGDHDDTIDTGLNSIVSVNVSGTRPDNVIHAISGGIVTVRCGSATSETFYWIAIGYKD